MWQEFPIEGQSSLPYALAQQGQQRREAVPLRSVSQRFHVQRTLGLTPALALGRAAAQLPGLRQDLRREGQYAATLAQARGRRTADAG